MSGGGREGQALVELALVLSLVAVVVIGALTFFGQRANAMVDDVGAEFGAAAGIDASVKPGRGKGSGNPGKGNRADPPGNPSAN